MRTLVIDASHGWLTTNINGVEKPVDFHRAWNRLARFHTDAAGDTDAFLDRVAGYVEELGFGVVTSHAADLFAAGICAAMEASRAGEGVRVVDEAGAVVVTEKESTVVENTAVAPAPVEFTRVIDLADLAAVDLPPVPDGFARRIVSATADTPRSGCTTVLYRDESSPTDPPPA